MHNVERSGRSSRALVLALCLAAPSWAAHALAQDTVNEAADAQATSTVTSTSTTTSVEVSSPTPRVVVTPPRERAETCGERAASIGLGAVVRVISGEQHGSGFLFHDASHVVTSFRIIREGHGISVIDADGNLRAATIVNTAQDDDLVMLQLASPLPGAPLQLAEEGALRVGAPIVVLSHGGGGRDGHMHGGPSTAGLRGLQVSSGTLSAIGDRGVRVDASLAGATSGGAIVDCDGGVVAMLSLGMMGWGDSEQLGASRAAIADLESRIDHPEGYGGRVSLFFGLGLSMAYEDPGGPMGGYAVLGLDVLDSFVLAGRFHYLMRTDTPTGSDALNLSNERWRGDAYVAWRQLVTNGEWGMHFELGLGGSWTFREIDVRRATIDDSGASPVVVITNEHLEGWSVRPMAVANLQLGPIVIGYTFEVDIDRRHVVHLFDLGFRF